MGASKSRLLRVGAPKPRFPHFKHFVEIAPGFWNLRAPFFVLGGTLNLGTHMSVVDLGDGRFVAIDCTELTAAAAAELAELTEGGDALVAVLTTHPFHTLAIPSLHALYPSTADRAWYGCPRHLLKCTVDKSGRPIRWAGDLNECATRRKFEPQLRMAIPAGGEFVDPTPPTRNHLSTVLVLHAASRTVHVDDCLNWVEGMGLLARFAGMPNRTLHFHPSLLHSGLRPTQAAPRAFRDWVQATLLDDWQYDNLATAHNGVLLGGAKQKVQELLARRAEELRKKSVSNALKEAEAAANASWAGAPAPDAPQSGEADAPCEDCWSEVDIECG